MTTLTYTAGVCAPVVIPLDGTTLLPVTSFGTSYLTVTRVTYSAVRTGPEAVSVITHTAPLTLTVHPGNH
jgi:hypothetical protein